MKVPGYVGKIFSGKAGEYGYGTQVKIHFNPLSELPGSWYKGDAAK